MPQRDEENLTEKIEELRKVQKEYSNTSKRIVETLKELRKSQKEYINMVKEHEDYWRSELGKTKYQNTERRKKLEQTLNNEEKILHKLERALKHTEERIKFHEKHES